MFIDNDVLSFLRHLIGPYYVPKSFARKKDTKPRGFTMEATFKGLESEDFQHVIQKLSYHKGRNTNGKEEKKWSKGLSISESPGPLISCFPNWHPFHTSPAGSESTNPAPPPGLILESSESAAFQEGRPRQQKPFCFLPEPLCLPLRPLTVPRASSGRQLTISSFCWGLGPALKFLIPIASSFRSTNVSFYFCPPMRSHSFLFFEPVKAPTEKSREKLWVTVFPENLKWSLWLLRMEILQGL